MKLYVVYCSRSYGVEIIGFTTDKQEAIQVVENRQKEIRAYDFRMIEWDKNNPRPAPYTPARDRWARDRGAYSQGISDESYGKRPTSYLFKEASPLNLSGEEVVP